MSRSKGPEPETKVAWLQSYGYIPGVPVFTEHHYVRTVECQLPAPDGAAWEHLYRCTKTKVERRWGVEDREVTLS